MTGTVIIELTQTAGAGAGTELGKIDIGGKERKKYKKEIEYQI